jgi:hypothetical protein
MLLSSLCFSKKVGQLQLCRHILEKNSFLLTMRLSKGGIHTNMLCKFMLHMIIGNLYGPYIITEKRCGNITRNTKISQQPSKTYNLCGSSSKGPKFGLRTRMRYSCLFLGLPCNRRRDKKNAISRDGTSIYWVTRASGVWVSMKLKQIIMHIE